MHVSNIVGLANVLENNSTKHYSNNTKETFSVKLVESIK